MSRTPEEACIRCHFLERSIERSPFGVVDEQRTAILNDDYSWLHDSPLSCYMGVWDEGYTPELRQMRRKTIVETPRKDFCFYFEHRPGMLFPAAKTLQEREAQLREAARDRRHTIIGLWIAATALIVSVLVNLAPYIWNGVLNLARYFE